MDCTPFRNKLTYYYSSRTEKIFYYKSNTTRFNLLLTFSFKTKKLINVTKLNIDYTSGQTSYDPFSETVINFLSNIIPTLDQFESNG